MRSGKKTRGNMLFYNLDTPDLTGNKHTHTHTQSRDGMLRWLGRRGWERGAVLASLGSGRYYKE